ncbi:hypothetical protein CY35_14G033700 [Sphagnum magellanicum]|nr:hypothetical protein CY35_14G033700 [Sphagnum magellanicum]KAH9540965.1 hypothetical protein CY35_14G033700 [Sphagnum magellanicum]
MWKRGQHEHGDGVLGRSMSWKQGSGSCSCVFVLCIAVVVLVVAAAAAISVPIILVRMKHENQLQIQQQSEVTFQLLSNALSFVNALALFGNDLRSWKPSFFQTHVQSVTTTAAAAAVTPEVPSTTPPAAGRKLLASENREQPTAVLTHSELTISFPTWLSRGDRRLLLAADSWSANVTVAQDGSGDYNTIQQAVDAAAAAASSSFGNSSSSSSKPAAAAPRYVIHIKEGIYHEIVRVSTPFLIMLGDGINKTIITGNRSATDPSMTTYQSATFGVTGKGFIAKGITFQNTAGAIAHQAVALRVSGDQSAFWQCSFDGFQDTLYTHALRQFYFGCTIYGTVDFVFGNAAAVLQNCTLLARPNLQGQENVYTAQGRTDPGQNTGFVLADCIIGGTPDLLPQSQLFPTFLGRPWKLYSLTVYINSTISGIVNPSGWLPWSGNFALDTLYFAEYESQGPGADPQARVNWSTQITDPSELAKFSVNNFLNAQEWLLPDTSR